MRVPDLDWAPDLFDDVEPVDENPLVITHKLFVYEERRLWPEMSALWIRGPVHRAELSTVQAA